MLCYCRVTAFIPDRDNFHAFHTIPQHGAKKVHGFFEGNTEGTDRVRLL